MLAAVKAADLLNTRRAARSGDWPRPGRRRLDLEAAPNGANGAVVFQTVRIFQPEPRPATARPHFALRTAFGGDTRRRMRAALRSHAESPGVCTRGLVRAGRAAGAAAPPATGPSRCESATSQPAPRASSSWRSHWTTHPNPRPRRRAKGESGTGPKHTCFSKLVGHSARPLREKAG